MFKPYMSICQNSMIAWFLLPASLQRDLSVIHPNTERDDHGRKESKKDGCGNERGAEDYRLVQPRHECVNKPEDQEDRPKLHLICQPSAREPIYGNHVEDECHDEHELHLEVRTRGFDVNGLRASRCGVRIRHCRQQESTNRVADVGEAGRHNCLDDFSHQGIFLFRNGLMAWHCLSFPPNQPDGKNQGL